MQYIVSLSGGIASAVAAERAICRYGRSRVKLWFADTLAEDEDLYRFVADCMARWGGRLYSYCDGRTPLQVAEDHHIIPNAQAAPCTYELKIKPFIRFVECQPRPQTVLIGMNWSEMGRVIERQRWHRKNGKPKPPTGYQRKIAGVYEDYPLLWKPLEYRPLVEVVRSWGIEPPRAYEQGFPHNNCLKHGCVKQGIREWQRYRIVYPGQFAQTAAWEQRQQAQGGARANRTILKSRVGGTAHPLALADLPDDPVPMFEVESDDRVACFCSY